MANTRRSTQSITPAGWLRTALLRMLAFMLIWAALSDASGWWTGAAVVLTVTLISLRMLPPRRRLGSWLRLLALLPLLALEAVRGGIDVAMRALRPSRPLDPDWLEIPLLSRRERYLFAYFMTLLPGTLAVKFTERGVLLHVVDRKLPVAAMAARIDRRLQRALQPARRP